MKKRKKNFNLFITLEIIALFCLISTYIYQTNEVAKFSYYIPEFEKHIAKLELQNQEMETRISAQYSDLNIDNLATNLKFEKVQTIQYIKHQEDKVVKTQ